MKSPIIKPIRTNGGTFYAFTSALEDISYTFNNENRKFKFSHFVLLNIPNIEKNHYMPDITDSLKNLKNTIQFEINPNFVLDKYLNNKSIEGNYNNYLSESFQNYCLNLETMILASKNYNYTLKRTVAERVFFKWLKELGCLRFKQADTSKCVINNESLNNIKNNEYRNKDGMSGVHYVEDTDNNAYTKIVRYIGEINIVNNLKNNNNAYSEIYIHIPSHHGDTPDVLFTSIEDENYKPNLFFKNIQENANNNKYIYNRTLEDQISHPYNLSIIGYYDSLSTFNYSNNNIEINFYYYDEQNKNFVSINDTNFKWWYETPDEYTYFLEKDYFTSPANDIYKIDYKLDNLNTYVLFQRSRLDGISIQFNPKVYSKIANSENIKNFADFASSNASSDFEFNAILIYYEVVDNNEQYDKNTSVKNLFGVLFLDNVEYLTNNIGYIPRLKKIKPNVSNRNIGNAYAFKLNLKFDILHSNIGVEVETSINDYNTFSLELFLESLNELRNSSNILNDYAVKINNLNREILNLKNLIYAKSTSDELYLKYLDLDEKIRKKYNDINNLINITELLNKNINDVQSIKENYYKLYNLFNKYMDYIILNNANNYTNLKIINGDFQINSNGYYYYYKRLGYREEYINILDYNINGEYNEYSPIILDKDVYLYIDDEKSWRTGDKLYIRFINGGIDLSNYYIFRILTDSSDKLKTGKKFNKIIKEINYNDILYVNSFNYRIEIEIICIDDINLNFLIYIK